MQPKEKKQPLDRSEYKITPAQPYTDPNTNDFIPNELLLFGYIREMERNTNVFLNTQTPLVIIHLIQSFFDISFNYQYIFVAAIKCLRRTSTYSSELIIHDLQSKKNLEITFAHQNYPQFWMKRCSKPLQKHNTHNTTFCGISNIRIPQWIQNKSTHYKQYFNQFDDKYQHYHIIAGCDDTKCGLLSINADILDREISIHGINNQTFSHNPQHQRNAQRKDNNCLSINAKWINLPLLRSAHNHTVVEGTLIAKRYNLLYFGGVEKIDTKSSHSKAIYLLNWSTDTDVQWKALSNTLLSKRCKPSGCLIYEKVSDIYQDVIGTQKIVIIGGYNKTKRTTLRSVELLSFENETKTSFLSNLNYGRSECGVCTTNDTNKKIIIGGGDKYDTTDTASEFTTKSVEFYDVNKDKWLVCPNFTRYTHRYKPSVWMLPSNPNIIYIAGDHRWNGGNGIVEMGVIEYCDLRDNRFMWKRHGEMDFCNLRDIMRFKSNDANFCPIQVPI